MRRARRHGSSDGPDLSRDDLAAAGCRWRAVPSRNDRPGSLPSAMFARQHPRVASAVGEGSIAVAFVSGASAVRNFHGGSSCATCALTDVKQAKRHECEDASRSARRGCTATCQECAPRCAATTRRTGTPRGMRRRAAIPSSHRRSQANAGSIAIRMMRSLSIRIPRTIPQWRDRQWRNDPRVRSAPCGDGQSNGRQPGERRPHAPLPTRSPQQKTGVEAVTSFAAARCSRRRGGAMVAVAKRLRGPGMRTIRSAPETTIAGSSSS